MAVEGWRECLLTVFDLRERIKDLPDDMPVILSKDAEGNAFSPLSSAEKAIYEPETTWYGDVTDLPPETVDVKIVGDHAAVVLVLGPVN